MDNSNESCQTYTFDIEDWKSFDWTVLKESDFENNKLKFIKEDLGE